MEIHVLISNIEHAKVKHFGYSNVYRKTTPNLLKIRFFCSQKLMSQFFDQKYSYEKINCVILDGTLLHSPKRKSCRIGKTSYLVFVELL